MIEEIHPDLCDNSVGRVINRVRFEKKTYCKNSATTLKKKGLAEVVIGLWQQKNVKKEMITVGALKEHS